MGRAGTHTRLAPRRPARGESCACPTGLFLTQAPGGSMSIQGDFEREPGVAEAVLAEAGPAVSSKGGIG